MEWRNLGELVERINRPNTEGIYGSEDVRGVSNSKMIQKTKANMEGRDFTPFTILHPHEFIFNRRTTRNGERLGLGFNQEETSYIFTEDYVAFRVLDENKILPGFLYVLFLRDEFDRYVRWDSWGSATEFFNWENMCRVKIPVPPIEEQKAIVDAWQGLRRMKEENEQMAEPLLALCRSYLQDLKHKYEAVEIGPYIEERNERNTENEYDEKDARGVNTSKEIQPCKRIGEKLNTYKIVHKDDFVFNANIKLTKESEKFAVANYCEQSNIIVTNFYTVFYIKNSKKILPHFLLLNLIGDDFARFVKFMSCSSVRDRFDFEEMKNVCIPLPPIEVQQAIVSIFDAANEAKQIAAEADRLSREVCPALIQKVIRG